LNSVDSQVNQFFSAVRLFERGKVSEAHAIFATLWVEYINSLTLLTWYARTADTGPEARRLIFKAYRRDPSSLFIIRVYSELHKKWKWEGAALTAPADPNPVRKGWDSWE
jgi:hypothetical protein